MEREHICFAVAATGSWIKISFLNFYLNSRYIADLYTVDYNTLACLMYKLNNEMFAQEHFI